MAALSPTASCREVCKWLLGRNVKRLLQGTHVSSSSLIYLICTVNGGESTSYIFLRSACMHSAMLEICTVPRPLSRRAAQERFVAERAVRYYEEQKNAKR